MNNEEFDKIIETRIEKIRRTLSFKQNEYAKGKDVLHNFKRAGHIMDCSPEKTLMFFKSKHDVSILDIVDEVDSYGNLPSLELVEEKIGDSINYLILLEAMINERMMGE